MIILLSNNVIYYIICSSRIDSTFQYERRIVMEAMSFEDLKREIFDREVPEKYPGIIQEFEGFEGQDYATPLLAGLPVDSKQMEYYLSEKICDNTMIDLGCGRRPEPREVAQHFKAGRYIGVDIRTLINKGKYDFCSRKSGTECFYFEHTDALEFVARLKDDVCGAYLLSALEVRGSLKDKRETVYLDALAAEMSRTLKPGGLVIFIGVMGDDFLELLGPERCGFQKVVFPDKKEEKQPSLPGMYATVYVKE